VNIFLITAMHQLIHIDEAINCFSIDKKDILFLVMLEGVEKESFDSYINKNEWKGIYHLPRWNVKKDNPFQYFMKIYFFHKILKKIKNFNETCELLLYCQYNLDYSNHIGNYFNSKQWVLLDEGNGSIKYSMERSLHIKNGRVKLRFSDLLKFFLFRFIMAPPSKLTFFSTYELTLNSTDDFISHNFPYLTSKLKFSIDNNDSNKKYLILGTPLVNAGILDEKEYLLLIYKIIAFFHNKKITYRPHRNESVALISKIKASFKVEIQLSNVPIELELMNTPVPVEVISFYSAALNNINLIFGSSIKCNCIAFDFDKILIEKNKIQIKNVYKSYERLVGDNFRIFKV
jgi:hypothetical protein